MDELTVVWVPVTHAPTTTPPVLIAQNESEDLYTAGEKGETVFLLFLPRSLFYCH